MSGSAQAVLLADGRRLHLHHGPIDIIAEAFGESSEVRLAYRQAAARFATVMEELVAELDLCVARSATRRRRSRARSRAA